MKTATRKKAPTKVKGVTAMTKLKHNFDGFAVRAQKGGYHFRQYVSAATGHCKTKKAAKAVEEEAYMLACEKRGTLDRVLTNPRSWRAGAPTKAATAELTKAGFTIANKNA